MTFFCTGEPSLSSDARVIFIVRIIISLCFLWDYNNNNRCHFEVLTTLNGSSTAHDIFSHVGSSGWVQLGNNQVRKELLDLFFTFLLSFFFQDWRAVSYLDALLCCGWAGSLFQREGINCFSISLVSEWKWKSWQVYLGRSKKSQDKKDKSTVSLSVMNAKWWGKKMLIFCRWQDVLGMVLMLTCSSDGLWQKNDWDGGQLQNLIPEMLLDGESELMVEPVSDMSKVGIQILLY